MGDFLSSFSSGLARFVMAWMTPALVTVSVATVVLNSQLKQVPIANRLFTAAAGDDVSGIVIVLGVALTLAVVLAYSALPLYRLLEGYYLPQSLARSMRQRHQQKLRRLIELRELEVETGTRPRGYSVERLMSYPDDPQFVMPTMLGNALRTLERFGISRYGCDSQLLWYEFQAVAPTSVRQDTHEGRAPVDFFVSAIGCLGMLTITSLALALGVDGRVEPLVLSATSVVLMRVAYLGAVRNMKDWAASVKAMINLYRFDVAERMRLDVPWWREGERHMWEQHIGAIEYNDLRFSDGYDEYRRVFAERQRRTGLASSQPDVMPD